MYYITKELNEMPMGHRILGHLGGCGRLHGHNYRMVLTVGSNELNELGFVCDFSELKAFRAKLGLLFDHRLCLHDKDLLLSMIPLNIVEVHIVRVQYKPTVENLTRHWFELAQAHFEKLSPPIKVLELSVYETKDAYATSRAHLSEWT